MYFYKFYTAYNKTEKDKSMKANTFRAALVSIILGLAFSTAHGVENNLYCERSHNGEFVQVSTAE